MSQFDKLENQFERKLSEIASALDEEDCLDQLLFGCADIIPDGRREAIKSVKQLFEELKKRGKLNEAKQEFLVDLLKKIGHEELACDLESSVDFPLDERTLAQVYYALYIIAEK